MTIFAQMFNAQKKSYRTGIAETSKVMNLMGDCLATNLSINLIPSGGGGGRICPPTTYFVVKHLKHIERHNFLTFPKYGFQTDLYKKKLNLLGVHLSGPLENVEIYFSKIDIDFIEL